jgi:transglutaminase-like putative cysteine protease
MIRMHSALLLLCLVLYCLSTARANQSRPSRTFTFIYDVHVPQLSRDHHTVRLWIPLPEVSKNQEITHLRIKSAVSYRINTGIKSRNRWVYLDFDPARTATPFNISIIFDVRRYEYRVAVPQSDPNASMSFSPEVAQYLSPDRLIPINGIVGELSSDQTRGISDPIEKAHRIYDYILRTMRYDHAGTGWGRGDAVWACSSHHGNCTDFHSLFIGMARAAGIPARFQIGFSLPANQHEGRISSYHCWAEFYTHGTGWVPIDASQAWLDPAKHDYYFGALDPNRILFTRGRDLQLTPHQTGDPLNYFVYPYAELDGKPMTGIQGTFQFRNSSSRLPNERARLTMTVQ